MIDIKVIASGSTGNAFYVSDGYTSLLIEAGVHRERIQRALGKAFADVSACLISHSHGDHAKGAAELARLGIDIYISVEEADVLGLTGHRIKHILPLVPFKVGTLSVMPFDVQHDSPAPMGYVISTLDGDRLLFFTDTPYIRYAFRGVTHILGECNHDRGLIHDNVDRESLSPDLAARIVKTHMCVDQFERTLKQMDRARLKQIHIIHISQGNGSPEAFANRIRRLTGVEVYIHKE